MPCPVLLAVQMAQILSVRTKIPLYRIHPALPEMQILFLPVAHLMVVYIQHPVLHGPGEVVEVYLFEDGHDLPIRIFSIHQISETTHTVRKFTERDAHADFIL